MSLGRKPRFLVFPGLLLVVVLLVPCVFAKDKEVRIPLPKRSHATPVQNLNREGVKALEKHDYAKAKRLFYQAYLLDPNDPFTLNNLGYVSELSGDIEGTGVQAGFIKLSAGDDGLTACETKILRAAVRAAASVRAAIASHTVRGSVVRDQLDIVRFSCHRSSPGVAQGGF